jgi:1-acyl-sn-glycerol-3-phosphate acyltransferase
MTYRFLRGIMKTLCAAILFGRIHVEGAELIPASGGLLIVGNHVGMIDPPLAGAIVKRDDVYFLAKSEHFSGRFKTWLFHGYHAFAVVRGTADRRALTHCLDLLSGGNALVLYPEGTRSAAMRRAQAGAGFIAQRSGVPILPMAVWGTEKVLRKGSKIPRRAHIHVRFGHVFTIPSAIARGDHDGATEFIMHKVAELLPVAYRGVYSDRATVA